MRNWKYLTRSEAKQSIVEGTSMEELQDQFKISKTKLTALLAGQSKKYKIPKNSMWYESEDEN